jgi:hypothetical protein
MLTKNKIAVESFAFENFTLPIATASHSIRTAGTSRVKIIQFTSEVISISANKGAETVNERHGLPLPPQIEQAEAHASLPMSRPEYSAPTHRHGLQLVPFNFL